ncbi:hypothetical protein QFZ96_002302 [Paraburkholderia youngii]
MDLRQIQALHAQYSGQPVVIDITRHTAAMPALPAPEGGKSLRSQGAAMTAALRTARRPALIAVAIAALAGLGGMSAARVWHATRENIHPAPIAVAPASAQVPATSQSVGDGTMPINAAPAKPLTASDLEVPKATDRPASRASTRGRSRCRPRLREPIFARPPKPPIRNRAPRPLRSTRNARLPLHRQPRWRSHRRLRHRHRHRHRRHRHRRARRHPQPRLQPQRRPRRSSRMDRPGQPCGHCITSPVTRRRRTTSPLRRRPQRPRRRKRPPRNPATFNCSRSPP